MDIDIASFTPEQRQQKFLEAFRQFDSIREGAEWVAKVTGSSVSTVMIWRCKKETGYFIPARPFMMLMRALEERNQTAK